MGEEDSKQMSAQFNQAGTVSGRMSGAHPNQAKGPSSIADDGSKRIPGLVTPQHVRKIKQRIRDESGPLSVDLETTGFSPVDNEACGLVLGFTSRSGRYLPFRHVDSRGAPIKENLPLVVVNEVVRAIEQSKRPVVMHGGRFDLAMGWKEGWRFEENQLIDTQIARWLLCRGVTPKGHLPMSLKTCSKRDLKAPQIAIGDVMDPRGFQYTPIEKATKYAVLDGKRTLALWEWCDSRLDEFTGFRKEFFDLEMPIVRVVAHMKRHGIGFDVAWVKGAYERIVEEMKEVQAKADAVIGGTFPMTSPAALSTMMFDELKWWVPQGERGASGRYSTAAAILLVQVDKAKPRGVKLVKLLLRWRKLEALRSRYTLSLVGCVDSDGKIRAQFNQAGTSTGRFSSSGPNLQNIPRPTDDDDPTLASWEKNLPPIRQAFVAGAGCKLIDIDYSQIELRLVAHFSRDPVLLEAYRNGEDIHQITADSIGSSRQHAKAVNFALIYGQSPFGLAHHIGVNQREAEKYHRGYFRKYGAVKGWQRKVEQVAVREGYVRMITGRHRCLPALQNPKSRGHYNANVREAINTKVQGSAADLIKIAMRNVFNLWTEKGVIDEQVRLLSQVHDEVIVEAEDAFVEEAAADLKHCFENAVQLRVPLIAEPFWGDNWLEAKG